MYFVDVETTGLTSPYTLLELGIVEVDSDLEVIDYQNFVFHYDLDPDELDPVIVAMHGNNGLLEKVRKSSLSPSMVVDYFNVFLSRNDQGKYPMCGSSVHFDRTVLKECLPEVEAWFHYRNIDVSSVKELVKLWYPEATFEDMPEPKKLHRAVPDCYDTIKELKYYKENFFRG